MNDLELVKLLCSDSALLTEECRTMVAPPKHPRRKMRAEPPPPVLWGDEEDIAGRPW